MKGDGLMDDGEFASAVERLRDAWQWFDLCDPEYAAAAVLNLESAMKAAGAAFIRAKFSRAKAASAEAHKADTLLVRFSDILPPLKGWGSPSGVHRFAVAQDGLRRPA